MVQTVTMLPGMGMGLVVAGDTVTAYAKALSCRIYRNSNQSIPSGAGWTDVVLSTAAHQAGAVFWSAGIPTLITIPVAGYYAFIARGTMDGTGLVVSETGRMRIMRNGSEQIASGQGAVVIAGQPSMMAYAYVECAVGDTIKVQVGHSRVTAMNLLNDGTFSPSIIADFRGQA